MTGPFMCDRCVVLFPASQELQQEHKEVQEIQIQIQRPGIRRLVEPFLIASMRVRQVRRLDSLCVISRETGKDQHADDRDCELHRR